MRILPSQSTLMKRKVGSGWSFWMVSVEAVAIGDARPIGQAGAAQRVGAEIEARVADGVHVEHRGEIVDVRRKCNRGGGWWRPRAPGDRACGALRAGRRRGTGWRGPESIGWRLVSAGPPLGGLYLKPPSAGGLCDGVITIPSASPAVRPWLYVKNGVRERGSGRVAERIIHHHLDAVRGEHFERADEGGFGERVRVLGEEQRAFRAVGARGIRRWPA